MSSYKHEEGILKFLKYFNGNSATLSQDFASYQNLGVLVWTKMKLAHGMTYIIELMYTELKKKNLAIREYTRVRKLVK
jgi:hypothetical protein